MKIRRTRAASRIDREAKQARNLVLLMTTMGLALTLSACGLFAGDEPEQEKALPTAIAAESLAPEKTSGEVQRGPAKSESAEVDDVSEGPARTTEIAYAVKTAESVFAAATQSWLARTKDSRSRSTPAPPLPRSGGAIAASIGIHPSLNVAPYSNGGAQSAGVPPVMLPATGKVAQGYPGPGEDPETTAEAPAKPDWDNPFLESNDHPLSTFSIDVDTASYAIVRRLLRGGSRPNTDLVRIEEMINYFNYSDPAAGPEDEHPFAANIELTQAPWAPDHHLMRIGLKGRELDMSGKQNANLVFLLDVSGSMQYPDKLPLLKRAMKLLVEQLGENDRVTMVVYAGSSGLVLPTTYAHDRETILEALSRLEAGGSTNGEGGIRQAYDLAQDAFIEGGVNRVILATDGDFNVGISDTEQLQLLIEEKAQTGVFLSVLGFGASAQHGGNLQDHKLETLADKGNGNYAYIDTLQEAQKVLVEEIGGTLVTIAKDVKLQLEFNPARIGGYRLIGYENRLLQAQDFNDDTKDAGEIGAGHSVTALYELVPAGMPFEAGEAFSPVEADEEESSDGADAAGDIDPLRYGSDGGDASLDAELLTLKLRYKQPDEDQSTRLEVPVLDEILDIDEASDDLRFSAAVAAFGMILRDSKHRGEANLAQVLELAQAGLGADEKGYRAEFLEIVNEAAKVGVQ